MTRLHRSLRTQDGITMIEMMVALVVGAIILTAGAAALASAMGGVNYSRQNQQSAELVSQIIEEARAGSYSGTSVKFDAAVFGADARLVYTAGAYWVDPDGAGSLASEKLVTSDSGTVPLTRTLDRNGTSYTVSTYVTEPTGADAAYRRVSTVVHWVRDGKAHERQATTFVTNPRRGLPLPRFTLAADTTVNVAAGSTLVLPVSVTNDGARDRWNMTSAQSPASGWTVSWYVDGDGDGVKDVSETTTVSDSDGDGTPDTGLLETDQVMNMLAVADIPSAASAGTVTVTLTATSSSDPTVSDTVTDTVVVSAAGSAGGWYLHDTNDEIPADGTLKSTMYMTTLSGGAFTRTYSGCGLSVPTDLGVPDYDTDWDACPGRLLLKGATTMTEADATKIALWERQSPDKLTLTGTAVVSLYVAPKDYQVKNGVLRVYLAERNNSVLTELGQATVAVSNLPATFSRVDIPVALSNDVVGKNKYLQVRVIAPPEGQDDLWLAYGTSAYPAVVTLPIVVA